MLFVPRLSADATNLSMLTNFPAAGVGEADASGVSVKFLHITYRRTQCRDGDARNVSPPPRALCRWLHLNDPRSRRQLSVHTRFYGGWRSHYFWAARSASSSATAARSSSLRLSRSIISSCTISAALPLYTCSLYLSGNAIL